MKQRNVLLLASLFIAGAVVTEYLYHSPIETVERPTRAYEEKHEDDDEEDSLHQWRKKEPWTEATAERHQELLERYMKTPRITRSRSGSSSYANGAIQGVWRNRGARNMPGAFKFTEMLDGTDTIYGVTHNHYSGEYNSKSYIFKGTIYNPKSGTRGDDFVRLTGHWPNRYKDLIALKVNGNTRLIAGIENGPLYWSEDDGRTWTKSTGLPSVLKSSTVNRQDNNKVYTTDGTSVYVSEDGGTSFTSFQNFGTSASSALYSPRYDVQQNASNLYLVRNGKFFTLSNGASSFVQNGSFVSFHGSKELSIGGDSRKLYVTENSNYWVSTNGGSSWTQKFPKGNWYGGRDGSMSAGKYLCVSPENTDHVIGGYAQPVFSRDGLNSDVSTTSGWGSYQNGTNLDADAYHNRIRFNYHPDFQASQFFYNSSGDLFSAHATDGGIFISYGVWKSATETERYDNNGYNTADFINVTTLNTTCPLIYRDNLFTGYRDETHIIYSTQDQGTQSIIPGTSGESLDFYQSIGGDGPPLSSTDGNHVWKWQREGGTVWAPASMYDASGNMRSAAEVHGMINNNPSGNFTKSSTVGWIKVHIDHEEPSKRIWLLSQRLDRAEVKSGYVATHSVTKGTGHQVSALAQAHGNADLVWFVQEGKVYKSTDRGTTFDNGTATPFAKTSNRQNIGDGWVLPTDDNWILFAGASSNSVGAILSKDGGATWKDVTGNFPYGDDAQVGGMIGTPNGKYVFAGTDIGPWVFVVETETWYPIGEGSAYFNTTAINFVESTNTVRFGTWGSGVWDFTVQDGSIEPFVNITAPNGGETFKIDENLTVRWNSFVEGDVTVSLLKNGDVVHEIGTVAASTGSLNWSVTDEFSTGSDFTVQVVSVNDGSLIDDSDSSFTIVDLKKLDQSHLSIFEVSSEETAGADGVAANTIDGNTSTIWHSEWYNSLPDFPHYIVYEIDTEVDLMGFEYIPRQDGANGTVTDYEVFISNDGSNWSEVISGTLPIQIQGSVTLWGEPVRGRYLKFVAKAEVNGNKYASMSEFNLFYSGELGGEVTVTKPESQLKSIAVTGISQGNIQLRVPSAGVYEFTLFTLNGRRIIAKDLHLSSGVHTVPLHENSLGRQMVVMKIKGDNISYTRKIQLQ